MATQPVDDSASDGETAGVVGFWRDHAARFGKFGVVGAFGVVVNWGFFELGFWAFSPLGEDWAYLNGLIAGLVVSIFTNFVLNDVWTWADRAKGGLKDWFHRLGKYYVSALVAGAIQVAVSWWARALVFSQLNVELPARRLPLTEFTIPAIDLGPRLGLFTGIACGMIVNFLAGHLWAFRDVESQ